MMQRRKELLDRIAVQREHLGAEAVRWQGAIRVADQAWQAVVFCRRHPVLLAGLTGLALLRKNSLKGVFSTGWRLWKGYRFLNNLQR